VLGFRQLDSERWPGSPLYVLDLSDRAKERLARDDRSQLAVLQVALKRKERGARSERFEVASATSDHVSVSARDIILSLNTLNTVGIGDTSYWLDTGSVVR